MCLPAAGVMGRCETIRATTAPAPPVRGYPAVPELRGLTPFLEKDIFS